jgi:hypothetical protein
MLVTVSLLGGLLPVGPRTREAWAPCGAWRMPVGDPYHLRLDRPSRPGAFFLLRGVEWVGSRASHQGADLGAGRAGSVVRAAATGVVVRTADHGPYGGYGTHVVLAHRLPEGKLIYTVYAHLRLGSIRVKPGRMVRAGTAIARVGATGRATTPHLHFEVRRPDHPEERWEFARVEDPLAFVEERLPTHRADTSGAGAYLEWAEYAALLMPGARGEDVLTREQWWRMLAAGVKGPILDLTLPAEQLCDSLVEAGVLPSRGADLTAGVPMGWAELARDIGRARSRGARTGLGPLRRAHHRRMCERTLGFAAPLSHLSALSGRAGKPCLTDAVVLLADLAGPAPEPPRAKPAVVPAKPAKPDTTVRSLPVAAKSRAPRRATADTLSRRAAGAPVAGAAKAGTTPRRTESDSVRRRDAPGAPVAGAAKAKTTPKGTAKRDSSVKRSGAEPVAGGARPKAKRARADSSSRRSSSDAPIAAPADSL